MNPTDIRSANPKIAVFFLDAGKSVEQSHLRLALANALQRIGELEERLKQIENRVLGRNAVSELED
jgi:predicted RNase H-like nuclease (RuvC/YqgF family)